MIEIPDFLKPELCKKDELTELSKLVKDYEKKFGKKCWSTEGLDFSDEQLEQVLEKCLQENKMFYEVIGINLGDLGEDDVI